MLWTAETLNVDDLASADRLDRWAEILRESLMSDFATQVAPTDGEFHGHLTKRWLDDVLHVNYTSSAWAGGLRPGSEIADYIGVGLANSSIYSEQVHFSTGLSRVVGSNLIVWDSSLLQGFSQDPRVGSAVEQTYVMFPRSGLRDLTSRLRVHGGILQPEAYPGQMLAALITMLNDPHQVLEPEAGMAIRNALIELVSGTVLSGIEFAHTAVSDAMRRKVENWVRSNLQHGDVSPAAAAMAHGLSLRSLHRLFEGGDETYGAFVRLARVECARQDVVASDESVQRIAMRWGFADASHFCREFRRVTGMTTSDCRAHGRALVGAS